jgi:hypothetical protein
MGKKNGLRSKDEYPMAGINQKGRPKTDIEVIKNNLSSSVFFFFWQA